MKGLLVGGGLVDLVTLHPLLTALLVIVALFAARRGARAFGGGRRTRQPRTSAGEGEGPRGASSLV
jgi:hypothetical protein